MSEERSRSAWRQHYESLLCRVRLFSLLVRDPGAPWYAKLIAASSLAYIFSPIQLIPNFIPVIGQLDDVLVLYVGIKLIEKLTPPAVLQGCLVRAAGMGLHWRPAGAILSNAEGAAVMSVSVDRTERVSVDPNNDCSSSLPSRQLR